MRLLRLVSPSQSGLTTSEWTNYFNDNLILKPNSKIGLLNASIPINLKTITIDSTNDTFKYKVVDNDEYLVVVLEQKSYSPEDFLLEMRRKINQKLNTTVNSRIGFLLLPTIKDNTDGDYITLSVFRGKEEQLKSYTNVNIVIDPNNQNLTRTGANIEDTHFLYCNLPLLTSCAYIRTQLLNTKTMTLGLVDAYDNSNILPNNNIKYMMGTLSTGVYSYYCYRNQQGEIIETASVPEINDILSIEIKNGSMYYHFYRGGNVYTLYSFPFDTTSVVYPVVCLRHPQASCSMPQLIYDPTYIVDTEGNITYEPIPDKHYILKVNDVISQPYTLNAPPAPPTNPIQSIFTFNFSKLGLKLLMGFTSNTLRGKGIELKFTGTSAINSLVIPKNLIVEIQDLYLDTFDSSLGKRRNILAIIPHLVQRDNNLIYECSSTPIMLDLFNAYEMNLRSLRVRILTRSDENDVLIDISDQIELTLLLD